MSAVPPRVASFPARGTVLAGKYEVERVLGVGGMGVVFAAMHLALDERVAIKMLLPELASQSDVVARFLREGRAAIKVRGEHVVRVLDVGTLDDGVPYIVMEYLEGADLDQVLTRDGPPPVTHVVGWVLQACEALADAHGRGLVHRDLKPANLFLTRGSDGAPFVKVLDFGISKIIKGGDDLGLTAENVTLGSPRYMAPEQARRDRPIDARTDVWSLGTILYEMLCGVPAFDAETLHELIAKTLMDTPVAIATHRKDVPEGLESVVRRCLEKDPDRRYATVAELAAALGPFGGAEGVTAADRVARILATALATDVKWSSGSLPPAATSGSRTTGPGLAATVEATRSPFASGPQATGWGATSERRSPRGRLAAVVVAFVVGAGAMVAVVFGGRLVGSPPSPHEVERAANATAAVEHPVTAASVATAPPVAFPDATRAGASPDAAWPHAPASVASAAPSAVGAALRARPTRRIAPPAPSPSGAALFEDRK